MSRQPNRATMEADLTKANNQDDATGFIRVNGLHEQDDEHKALQGSFSN